MLTGRPCCSCHRACSFCSWCSCSDRAACTDPRPWSARTASPRSWAFGYALVWKSTWRLALEHSSIRCTPPIGSTWWSTSRNGSSIRSSVGCSRAFRRFPFGCRCPHRSSSIDRWTPIPADIAPCIRFASVCPPFAARTPDWPTGSLWSSRTTTRDVDRPRSRWSCSIFSGRGKEDVNLNILGS